jgi:hypothetical protein
MAENSNGDQATLFHGAVPGVSIGDTFENQASLIPKGVHGNRTAGIWTKAKVSDAAGSIVLNGGYPDDQNFGDRIIYTGMGGQTHGRQTEDQSFEQFANRALLRNLARRVPVRVIRGHKGDPERSPSTGYRYDGLYHVTRAWQGPGRTAETSTYQMCMFQLERAGLGAEPQATSDRKHHVSALERLAVERQAVAVVTAYFEELGYEVTDVGVPGHPYDLIAADTTEQLRVEVKGRRGTASTVDVTHNEVIAARQYDRSVLAVVDEIDLAQDDGVPVADGGRLRIWLAWQPQDAHLKPTQYRYSLPERNDLP